MGATFITEEQAELMRLKQVALQKIREAETACHEYFKACPVGSERSRAYEVYLNVHCSTRVE